MTRISVSKKTNNRIKIIYQHVKQSFIRSLNPGHPWTSVNEVQLTILSRKTHPQTKLKRLQKVLIWIFG